MLGIDIKDVNIKRLALITKSLYGDNFEIEDEKEAGYIQITIHFPEVIITNSKRLSHTIKDLFVRFNIYTCDRGKVRFSRLYGKRTTFDIKELIHGYCHSHLPKRYTYFLVDDFVQWCLGTTEINTIISDYEFSYEAYELLLVNIREYVAWESLEGGPYIYLKDTVCPFRFEVIANNNNNYNRYETFDSYETIYKYLNTISEEELSKLNLDINSNLNNIQFNEGIFKNHLLNIIPDIYLKKEYTNIIASKFTKNFNYSSYRSFYAIGILVDHYIPNDNKDMFLFKGQYVKSKIIFEEDGAPVENTVVKTLTNDNYTTLKSTFINLIVSHILKISNKELIEFSIPKHFNNIKR